MGRPRGGHDRTATTADRSPTPALRRVLAGLHVRGALFLRAHYTEPWAYRSLSARDAVAALAPDHERLVLFHLVGSGRCWVEVEGRRVWAGEGDVIVMPYGHAHRMGGVEDAEPVPLATLVAPPPWDRMPVIHHGEGGPGTEVVCGYLTAADPLFDPRLRVFPPVFVVTPPEGPAREWVRAGIEYAAEATAAVGPDRVEAPAGLPQVLLAEVLGRHLATAPSTDAGWLAAIRDPVVAPALAAIHGDPAAPWDLLRLAAVSSVSVSLLDQRFRDLLGLAPIRYLAAWRMHVAAELLASTRMGVAAVARRVGYDSEEAFSRAFKRALGRAPSRWREAGGTPVGTR